MPNVYILGPYPSEAILSSGIIPSSHPWDELHYSCNSSETECLTQGLFNQTFLNSLPAGYTQITYAAAKLKRVEWG